MCWASAFRLDGREARLFSAGRRKSTRIGCYPLRLEQSARGTGPDHVQKGSDDEVIGIEVVKQVGLFTADTDEKSRYTSSSWPTSILRLVRMSSFSGRLSR